MAASSRRKDNRPKSIALVARHNTLPEQPLPRNNNVSALPIGPCSFRELTAGHLCGCRRFWQKRRAIQQTEARQKDAVAVDETGLCYCGHHACYHGQEQDISTRKRPFEQEDVMLSEDLSTVGGNSTRRLRRIEEGAHDRGMHQSLKSSLAIRRRPLSQHQLSHASSISDCVSQARSKMAPGPEPSGRFTVNNHTRTSTSLINDRSSTEIAPTPSVIGSPEIRAVDHINQHGKVAIQSQDLVSRTTHRDDVVRSYKPPSRPPTQKITSGRRSAVEQLSHELLTLRPTIPSVPDLQSAIADLYARLEAMEHISSTYDIPEDMMERLERLESVEARSAELESRLEELEHLKELVETRSTTASFERRFGECDLMQNQDVVERLDNMEKRLLSLKSREAPSRQSPWQVEVVVLPYGRELHGLWSESENLPSYCAWSRMMNTVSPARTTSTWFSPRACAPGSGLSGLVYARLRSRGFVQTINLTDESARHPQDQLSSAFGELLPLLPASSSSTVRKWDKRFLGLQSPLIPLRKLHKESQLQYLVPAEMVTPALWSVVFLDSSVLMKAPAAGLRRLYVSTAEAYMQNMQEEPGNEMSWSDLRHMPTRCSSSGDHGEGLEEDNDDIHCWTPNLRLDHGEGAQNLEVDAVRSSSPFDSESSSNTDFILPDQDLATPSPQIKHESSDDEHLTHLPITPSSIYPSSQPRQRYNSLQSMKVMHMDTQDTVVSSSPAPSLQKRRVNSSFESRGSAGSELLKTHTNSNRSTKSRKKGRYDAPITNKKAYDKNTSDSAEMAYATPHSLFPGTATRNDKPIEDIGGDTDVVVSDEEFDAASSTIMYGDRVRAPARLITSMGDLTMRDCVDASGEEEELEGSSESESGIDEFTDNDEYDDEGYNVDAWP